MINFLNRVYEYFKIVKIRGVFNLFLARLSQKNRMFELQMKESKESIHLRMPSSDIWVYKQIFIDTEYKFTVVKQPKIIIDAGANIGLASIYFSQMFPDAKIIALEPELSNFTLLLENVKKYKNILPIQAALWSHNTKINICNSGHGEWGFMTYDKQVEDIKVEHEVEAFSVDQLIDKFALDRIDILKIDIEGAELEVFNDTKLWLEKVDSLIVELHDRMKKGCSRTFYNNTPGFEYEWVRGENIYLSRGNIIE